MFEPPYRRRSGRYGHAIAQQDERGVIGFDAGPGAVPDRVPRGAPRRAGLSSEGGSDTPQLLLAHHHADLPVGRGRITSTGGAARVAQPTRVERRGAAPAKPISPSASVWRLGQKGHITAAALVHEHHRGQGLSSRLFAVPEAVSKIQAADHRCGSSHPPFDEWTEGGRPYHAARCVEAARVPPMDYRDNRQRWAESLPVVYFYSGSRLGWWRTRYQEFRRGSRTGGVQDTHWVSTPPMIWSCRLL